MLYLWIAVGVIAWAVMHWTDKDEDGWELAEDE